MNVCQRRDWWGLDTDDLTGAVIRIAAAAELKCAVVFFGLFLDSGNQSRCRANADDQDAFG